jgi:hypothetical protein
MATSRMALGAIITFLFGAISSESFASDDCAKGDALQCYTQALVRLQAAQDALSSASKDINSLRLPQNTVIFVMSADCNGLGQDWSPLDPKIVAGHFIVGAGGEFVVGQPRPGVDRIVIDSHNLPTFTVSLPFKQGELPGGLSYHGGPHFVAGLGEGTPGQGTAQPPFAITFSGESQAILVAPPALPLTACQKK